MDLITLNELLIHTHDEYAIPAVNCFNLEMIQAVLEAAEELRSPIIVQSGSKDVNYSSPETIVAMAQATAKNKHVRFAIHLDHGHGYDMAVRCIRAGYTSVMFDGSTLNFQENIAMTSKVVELAHAAGISCEAELGTIGNRDEEGEKIANDYKTDPDAAGEFVRETSVDCLAIGIGNAHGFYPLPPKLDLARLEKIKTLTNIPLVLHGGSGLPEEQIKAAIKLGIAKINFSTAARNSMISQTKEYIEKKSENLKADLLYEAGRSGFKKAVYEMIHLCGSENKV
ncbi:MAG TPA: tagatose-bisphosphate aldolase [Clostridiales bacterium]|nr:tagatose-bisphosphate aldolase [Clostridiales bacterium]